MANHSGHECHQQAPCDDIDRNGDDVARCVRRKTLKRAPKQKPPCCKSWRQEGLKRPCDGFGEFRREAESSMKQRSGAGEGKNEEQRHPPPRPARCKTEP